MLLSFRDKGSDTAKWRIMQRTVPHNKEFKAQNVSGAETEKHC